jgi:hypothetical protein
MMAAPALSEICRAICCPKRKDRCAADDATCNAVDQHFAAGVAVRTLFQTQPAPTGNMEKTDG